MSVSGRRNDRKEVSLVSTRSTEMRTQTGWKTGLNLVLAAWLFISPWVVVPSTLASSVNAWASGAVIFLVALATMRSDRPEDIKWLNALLGAWVFVAPWILGFAAFAAPAWNAWIVGAAIALLALWSGSEIAARHRATQERRDLG